VFGARWAEDGAWEIPVFALSTSRPHGDLPGIVDSAGFDVVVVDSPPLEQERGIVHSAMRAATDVAVTLAPTSPEWSALPRVWAAARDVDSLRTRPVPTSVLGNRVRTGTTAAQVYRELLADAGRYCLRAAIPTRARSAQLVGAPVVFGPEDTAALDAADEITKRGGRA
jgi:chromosome partitioning protein